MAAQHGGKRPGAGRKPGRVAKAKLDIAERAKTHGNTALAVLVEVATDAEQPAAARVSAANALLDRGYGRPMQAVDHTTGGEAFQFPQTIVIKAADVDGDD